MQIYNLDALVKVTVTKKKVSRRFIWQDYKKGSFFKKEVKEGFVNSDPCYRLLIDGGATFTKDELEKSEYIVEGKVVYDMPTVFLYFNNNSDYQHYEKFQNDILCRSRAKEIVGDKPNLLYIY